MATAEAPLRRADAWLRLGLSLGCAFQGGQAVFQPLAGSPAASWVWGAVLLGIAAWLILGSAPLGATIAALLCWLAGLTLEGGPPLGAGIAVAASAGARIALQVRDSGAWLRDLRHLHRAWCWDLLGMELARSRSALGPSSRGRHDALRIAGDRYERAGRAQARLLARGVDTTRLAKPVRQLGSLLGSLLGRLPDACRRAEALLDTIARRYWTRLEPVGASSRR